MPELLMPDEFKAYIKVKIDNQNFNKLVILFLVYYLPMKLHFINILLNII